MATRTARRSRKTRQMTTSLEVRQRVLRTLTERGTPITVTELSKVVGIRPTTVRGAVGWLEVRGFIAEVGEDTYRVVTDDGDPHPSVLEARIRQARHLVSELIRRSGPGKRWTIGSIAKATSLDPLVVSDALLHLESSGSVRRLDPDRYQAGD